MSPESSPGELTTVFAHLHGMLLSVQDATTAVHQLARAAHQTIPAAAGAGVSLLDEDGRRVSTASTDALVEAADAQRPAGPPGTPPGGVEDLRRCPCRLR